MTRKQAITYIPSYINMLWKLFSPQEAEEEYSSYFFDRREKYETIRKECNKILQEKYYIYPQVSEIYNRKMLDLDKNN